MGMKDFLKSTKMNERDFARWVKDQLGDKLSTTDFGDGQTYNFGQFASNLYRVEFFNMVVDYMNKRAQKYLDVYGSSGTIQLFIAKSLYHADKHTLSRGEITDWVKGHLPFVPDEMKYHNGIPSGQGRYETNISRELNHMVDSGWIKDNGRVYTNKNTYTLKHLTAQDLEKLKLKR